MKNATTVAEVSPPFRLILAEKVNRHPLTGSRLSETMASERPSGPPSRCPLARPEAEGAFLWGAQ